MAIWFKEVTLDDLNRFGKNSMSEFLGIQFIEIGDNFLKASMPVTERTKQPFGLLHGGANVVLAETIASTAANGVIDSKKFYCVGLEINANHLRAVTKGIVTAKASPIHIGRTTQVWEVDIFNEEGKKTCVSRMTAAVVGR
ncbi:esterase [Legionella birminghamensis]|uniref:Esterase n=1 Tax=Legionella birminghamensis TaxID=28083 RepID=A0A378I8V6_9GAMM|nr:hotdog fold thioesterase [Legionella birminghamensis]KTC69385.1 esterase [Legionella birminghamensis]STX31648.1 esterase [Legionella birminghamensis]